MEGWAADSEIGISARLGSLPRKGKQDGGQDGIMYTTMSSWEDDLEEIAAGLVG